VAVDRRAAEGQRREHDLMSEQPRDRLEAAHRLRRDLRADAVPGQYRDVRFHARRS
jgi:hypothetical protein